MGDETMSDVEKQIEQWRAGLASSETFGNADIRELEIHLREELEHLRSLSLSDEEAFLVAHHRLGDTAALENEYAKVNTPRRLTNHLWWLAVGVFAYLVADNFAGATSQISLGLAQEMNWSPHVLGIVAGAATIGAFCAMAALALWLSVQYLRPGNHSHVQVSGRVRLAFLLGLFVETLAIAVRGCAHLPVPGFRAIVPQDFTQIVRVEPSERWLTGPVLFTVLFLLIHLAGRQKTETA
jgi:hypothetical protein